MIFRPISWHLRGGVVLVATRCSTSGLAIANVLGTGVQLNVSRTLIPPMDLLQRLLRE